MLFEAQKQVQNKWVGGIMRHLQRKYIVTGPKKWPQHTCVPFFFNLGWRATVTGLTTTAVKLQTGLKIRNYICFALFFFKRSGRARGTHLRKMGSIEAFGDAWRAKTSTL